MDSSKQPTADTEFRDAAMLLAFEQCLREFGVKGAMGCTSLARDAADELLAKRNEVKQP